MTDTDALPDFRRLPVPKALGWLAEHGEPGLHLEPDAAHGHIDHPGDAGALKTIAAIADWLARP